MVCGALEGLCAGVALGVAALGPEQLVLGDVGLHARGVAEVEVCREAGLFDGVAEGGDGPGALGHSEADRSIVGRGRYAVVCSGGVRCGEVGSDEEALET